MDWRSPAERSLVVRFRRRGPDHDGGRAEALGATRRSSKDRPGISLVFFARAWYGGIS